jgi:hypothetical protein
MTGLAASRLPRLVDGLLSARSRRSNVSDLTRFSGCNRAGLRSYVSNAGDPYRNLISEREGLTPAPDRIALTLIPPRRSSSKPRVFQRPPQSVSVVEMENKSRARLDQQRLQFRVRRGPNEGVYRLDQFLQEDHFAIKVRLVELVSFDCVEPRKVAVALLRQRIADRTSLWSRRESLHQSGGFLVELSMLVNHPTREKSYASRLRSAQGYLAGRDFRLIRHKEDADDLCIRQTRLLAKCANRRCEEQQ